MASPLLPVAVLAALRSACVGFSGSRSVVPPVLSSCCAAVPSSSVVLVGCAGGVDAAVRRAFPSAVVFSVGFSGRGAFAARSSAFVRSLQARGGVLFSFPSGACPAGLLPSSSWRSAGGSGSWGSLALAIGLGVPCFVFCPAGVPSGWGFEPLGGGWFRSMSVGNQLSLF
jgi:hypothetical protein